MALLLRTTRVISLVLALLLATGATAHASEVQVRDVVKKAFDVRPGGTLVVDMDHGNVEVLTTREDRVLIELERIAQADNREQAQRMIDQHVYDFRQVGNDVRIRSRYEDEKGIMRRWRNQSRIKLRLTVRVPEQYNVDFSSGAGNVEIYAVEGRIEGRTGAGNIELDDVRGTVDITSGAGNIEVGGDVSWAKVHTGAGNIELYNLTGAVEANTGAGNVTAEIMRQPSRASSLSSGAGNVTVHLARTVGVYVDATAALGSAECEYDLKVEGKWLKKSFAGEVNGGGPELRIHAGVGNVALLRD